MSKLLASLLLLVSAPAFAVETAFEEDHSLPLVYVNVAVKAGSVTDPDGQSGVSNFMGEMLLRGTKKRTKEQIDLELDQMGATLDVEVRAEALILRGVVLARELEPFLRLVTDIVTQPSFPPREINKLKSEIVSGILEELGKDSSLGNRRFTKHLFQDHPYGKPVLGVVKDVEALDAKRIAAHYNRLFRDKNLLIVGAGDAPQGKMQEFAAALGKARAGGEEIPKVAPPQDSPSRRLLIVDKGDRTQTTVIGGQVGIRMTDPDFFPLYLANHAFGGGSFSARMMVEIRVKRGWAYGAYSYFRHGRQPRQWSFTLQPAAKDAAPALDYALKMIEELQAKGVTAEEFDFAKRSQVNSAGFMFNTPSKRVENKLLERTLDLPDGFMKTYGPEMEKVTIAQANAAVRKFVQPYKMSITVVATAKDLKEPLAKAVAVPVDQVVVKPYTEE